MVLKRVGVWSVARMMGLLYAVLGLFIGGLCALVALLGAGIVTETQAESALAPWFGLAFGVGAVVFLPVFYGLLGLIGGAISAALYNVVARMIGGMELELE
jgi:hypothetical protein